MTPLGSGIDIVELQRVAAVFEKSGHRFVEKVLHANEIEELDQWSDKVAFIAKRFAVKEAAAKALGVGIGKQLSFKDMYVDHDELGKPILKFIDDCAERLNLKEKYFLLTIADEKAYAVAHVMMFEK